jgi:hypothetical protein
LNPNPIEEVAHEDVACDPEGIQTSSTALWLATFWDVVTSVALIAFPVVILTSARLSPRVTMFATLRFALISVVVWISVVRSASSYSFDGIDKTFWLHLWGSIENSTSIIIANCPAIRSQLQSRGPTRRSLAASYTRSMHSTRRSSAQSHLYSSFDTEIDEGHDRATDTNEVQESRRTWETWLVSAFSDTSNSEHTGSSFAN